MTPSHSSVYGLTLGLILCAAPSVAQNLITNPGFEDDLNGWVITGSFWGIVLDVANPCASVEASYETATISQCVSEVVGEHQVVGTSARRLSGDLQAFINLTFYSEPHCGGSMSGPLVFEVDPTTTWQAFRRTIIAPPGTQSVRVLLATSPEGQGILLFDDVQFHVPLFTDGFEGGTTEGWTMVVAGP